MTEPRPLPADATRPEQRSTFGRVRAVSGGLSGFSLLALALPILTATSCNSEFSDAATQANGFDLLSGFDASTPGGPSGAVTHVPGTWLIALTALVLVAAAVICAWRSRLAPLGAGVLAATAIIALEATVRHVRDALGANNKIHVWLNVPGGLGVELLLSIVVLLGMATAVRIAAARWRGARPRAAPGPPWPP